MDKIIRCFVVIILVGMANVYSASDNFTGSNGTGLKTHDANWKDAGQDGITSNWQIQSNALSVDDWSGGYYDGSSDTSIATIPTGSGAYVIGLGVRMSSGNHGYTIRLSEDRSVLRLDSNTSNITYFSTGKSNASHVYKITARGTNPLLITAYVDGDSVGAYSDDTPKSDGYAGIRAYGAATLDDWSDGVSSCATPTGTNPSNRVDTIGQSGKFALVHDGCEPDSFRFINKGSLDSVALVATKDSVAYRLKNLQKTAVQCSLSLWYGGSAVDTVTWTWRVTGPVAAFSATRDTLTVGILDTTHQTIPDSLTDSVTCASLPAGLSIFKTGTNMGDFYGTLEHLTTYYPMVKWWRGGVAADSTRDTIVARWDTAHIDSVRRISDGNDSGYYLDSMRAYIYFGSNAGIVDSVKIGDSTATVGNVTGTSFDFKIPDSVGIGWVQMAIHDSVSSDTLDSAFYCLGEAPVPPDTFQLTISITGNHLAEPDIDTTPYTADGRYEAGTEITLTATQAAYHKLVPTATFPASPLVFTITRDTTIVIQSDTFPKFTRDTIIVGGHATVAVVPATLTPVDSATACTTSVPSVDEGWRCDSIKSNSSVVYYPATRITYTIGQNRVDTVFVSEIPIIPDSSTLTLTQSVGGTVSAEPTATRRAAGDQSVITATDTGHYHFVAWVGDLADSSGNPLTYTYPAAGSRIGSAVFGLDSFGLSYTITGGNAAVTFLVDSIGAYGETVTCTLTVLPHYTADWPGGHVGAGKHPYSVMMLKDSLLQIVTHAVPQYTVDTTWGVYLSAWAVSGGLTHDSGTTVSMSASCESCSSFVGYSGDYTEAGKNGSFVITGNMSIGASCGWGTCGTTVNKMRWNAFRLGFKRVFR